MSEYTTSEDRRNLLSNHEDDRLTETEIIECSQRQSPNFYGTFRGGVQRAPTSLYPVHATPEPIASSSRSTRVRPKRYRLAFLILLGFDVALVLFLSIICYLNDNPNSHSISAYFTFNLNTSVFDLVMVSIVRFVLDFLFYLLLGWVTRIVLCITTLLSTIYVPIKAFYYWSELLKDNNSNSNGVVQYILVLILLFSAFALPWLLAFFFEFKYLPTELSRVNVTTWKDYRAWFCPWLLVIKPERTPEQSITATTQHIPELHFPPPPSSSSLGRYQSLDTVFRTPLGSVRASPTGFLVVDDDLEAIREEERRTPPLPRGGPPPPAERRTPSPAERRIPSPAEYDQYSSVQQHQQQGNRYRQLGSESLEKLVSLSKLNGGWTLVRTQDDIKCYSLQGESRKIWKSEMMVTVSAERLWTVVYYDIENTKDWNSSVILSEVVERVDQNTDIIYTSCPSVGPISQRDFVTVRQWAIIEGVYYDTNVSTTHTSKPPQRNTVRGENGPCGYAVVPLEAHKCLFIWILDTDYKGWIPQSIIDQNTSSIIFSTNKSLRTYVTRSLNASN